jgi:hypothetical protein
MYSTFSVPLSIVFFTPTIIINYVFLRTKNAVANELPYGIVTELSHLMSSSNDGFFLYYDGKSPFANSIMWTILYYNEIIIFIGKSKGWTPSWCWHEEYCIEKVA